MSSPMTTSLSLDLNLKSIQIKEIPKAPPFLGISKDPIGPSNLQAGAQAWGQAQFVCGNPMICR
jgi:hypothetical protein